MDREPERRPMSPGVTLRQRTGRHRNWVEPLRGRVCSRITIDRYAPALVMWFLNDGPAARVEIDSLFRLQVGPDEWPLDPWRDRATLAPVLSLIDRTVITARAREDGSLQLEFTGNASVEVGRPEGVSEPWWFDLDADDGAPNSWAPADALPAVPPDLT